MIALDATLPKTLAGNLAPSERVCVCDGRGVGITLLVGICGSAVIYTEPALLVSCAYFLLIGLIVTQALGVCSKEKLIVAFCFSIIIALYQYHINWYMFPDSKGFMTGQFGTTTADDEAFFIRTLWFIKSGTILHPFAAFAGIVSYPLKYIKDLTHPDFLMLNALGHALTAVFVMNIAGIFTGGNRRAKNIAFFSSIFCGLLMYDGLTFMRDGWTATFFIIMLWALYTRHYIILLVSLGLLGTIRVGSLLAAIAFLILIVQYSKKHRNFSKSLVSFSKRQRRFTLFLIAVILVIAFPIIYEYLAYKGILDSLYFRSSFLLNFDGSHHTGPNAVFDKIVFLPDYLRIPLSFLHYTFAPYIRSIYLHFIPEKLFPGLYVLWFALFLPAISRGVLYAWRQKRRDVLALFFGYLLMIFILSQYSLQLRHKDMVLPILILLAAYGVTIKSKNGTILGICVSVLYVGVSVGREIIQSF